MLNWATSKDSSEALDLKSLAKRLLAAVVEAIEAGGWELPPASVEETYRGRRLTWWRSPEAGPPCRKCGVDQLAYIPMGEGFPLDFCPACWSLRGGDSERGVSVDVGMGIEKASRDLPPGMTMQLRLGGETFPARPKTPATDAERATALEAYAASAVRRFEIGRQVWMARMAFEGMNGVRQDYGESRRWFERAATWNCGEAFTTLGLMALHGLGEPVNRARAVALCRHAAERGYTEAQTGMGRLCWDGVGVMKDPEMAVAWFRLAAEKKDREAQLWLASALILGEGVERDAQKGLALLEEAARAGYAEAQAGLGKVLLEGSAGRQDEAEAIAWLKKAADQGDDWARARLEALGAEAGEPRG